MEAKTKEILKTIAIIVFVPSLLVAGYFGVTKGIDFFQKKKSEGDLKKVLDALKIGIEKRAKESKQQLTEKAIEDTEKKWMDELKKLSPKAMSTFSDWFVLTVPYGKDKTGAWAYEVKSPQQGDEFNKKKDALYPKYNDELMNKTKVEQLFEEFDKSLGV